MKFYFSWIPEEADIQELIPRRYKEDIFFLEITEQEGKYPRARLLIKNPYEGLLSKERQQRALITAQIEDQAPQIIFVGNVIGVPVQIEGEMLEIILTAEPKDASKQLDRLNESLKQFPYWDPLFVSEDDKKDMIEVLDGRPALPYWSRKGEPVRLSDIFWGSQTLELGSQFFRDQLRFHLSGMPLSSIHVRLKAEWIQRYQGRTNISYFLRCQFPKGLISTFTGDDLQAKWWRTGETLDRSNYWIEESYLKEIPAPFTGVLGFYPGASQTFRLSPYDPLNKTGEPQTVKLKRSWFRTKVILGWMYRQKRVETLSFTLHNHIQSNRDFAGKSRSLKLNLQPITDDEQKAIPWRSYVFYKTSDQVFLKGKLYQARQQHVGSKQFNTDQHLWQEVQQPAVGNIMSHQASFFASVRGQQAVEHALAVASAHLAASSRAVEIILQAPFDRLMRVDCDHSIHIVDERLPGGQAWGKVKALRLIAEGQTGRLWGEVTLGTAIGYLTGTHASPVTTAGVLQDQYCFDDYCQEGTFQTASSTVQTAIGVSYQSCLTMPPRKGIVHPEQLTAYDIVEGVKIINGPDEQQSVLQQNQYPVRHSLRSVLRENTTNIAVRLKDLRAVPKLKHHIDLKIDGSWSVPKQIDLEAPKHIEG